MELDLSSEMTRDAGCCVMRFRRGLKPFGASTVTDSEFSLEYSEVEGVCGGLEGLLNLNLVDPLRMESSSCARMDVRDLGTSSSGEPGGPDMLGRDLAETSRWLKRIRQNGKKWNGGKKPRIHISSHVLKHRAM